MDSLSQAALGAAIAIGVMRRRTALWKAAAWGAVAGTLPDLDVLLDHGDPLLNMVLHRAETHALFWLSLFSLPFALAVARLQGEWAHWRHWWLALWLVLITHPLLDAMTVYGTQLWLPFSDTPVGLGSIFIIDPLYTLPLLLGVLAALVLGRRKADAHAHAGVGSRAVVPGHAAAAHARSAHDGQRLALRLNAAGLLLSTAYLGWSAAAQAHVQAVARESLVAQGLAADRLLVGPTPFNTVLWRVLAIDKAGSTYREGFYSLRDAAAPPAQRVVFDRFERGNALAAEIGHLDRVQRLQAFSRGLWAVAETDGRLRITDLRMGQEPAYTFSFVVAERHSAPVAVLPTESAGRRADLDRALPWLWRRMNGEPLPPPR